MKALHIHLHSLPDDGAVTATAWVEAYLSQPRSVDEVKEAARLAHFNWSAILNAARRLDVHSIGGWWELPMDKEAA